MESSRVAARTAAAIVVALLLAGCSVFAPQKTPAAGAPASAQPAVQPSSQSNVSDAQRQSDIDSCREQARAMLRQEDNITADINSRDGQGAFRSHAPDLRRNLNEYESRQRYHRIFEDCLRNRGYVDGDARQ